MLVVEHAVLSTGAAGGGNCHDGRVDGSLWSRI